MSKREQSLKPRCKYRIYDIHLCFLVSNDEFRSHSISHRPIPPGEKFRPVDLLRTCASASRNWKSPSLLFYQLHNNLFFCYKTKRKDKSCYNQRQCKDSLRQVYFNPSFFPFLKNLFPSYITQYPTTGNPSYNRKLPQSHQSATFQQSC